MFYRVILDCRPSSGVTWEPFLTIKFVEAESEDEAFNLAADRTKALMREKGFKDDAIADFELTLDDIELFDRREAVFDSEHSFIFYPDG